MRQLNTIKADFLFPLFAEYEANRKTFSWPSFIRKIDAILKGKTPESVLSPSELYQLAKEIHGVDCTIIKPGRDKDPEWKAFRELRKKLMPYYVVMSDLYALGYRRETTFTDLFSSDEMGLRIPGSVTVPPESEKDRKAFLDFKDTLHMHTPEKNSIRPEGEQLLRLNRIAFCASENPFALILDLICFSEEYVKHGNYNSYNQYWNPYLDKSRELLNIILKFEIFTDNQALRLKALEWLNKGLHTNTHNPLILEIVLLRIPELEAQVGKIDTFLETERPNLDSQRTRCAETKAHLASLKETLNTPEYIQLQADIPRSAAECEKLQANIQRLANLERDTTRVKSSYREEVLRFVELEERNKAYLPQVAAIKEAEKKLGSETAEFDALDAKIKQFLALKYRLLSMQPKCTEFKALSYETHLLYDDPSHPWSSEPMLKTINELSQKVELLLSAEAAVPLSNSIMAAASAPPAEARGARAGAGGPVPEAYQGHEGSGAAAKDYSKTGMGVGVGASTQESNPEAAAEKAPTVAVLRHMLPASAPNIDLKRATVAEPRPTAAAANTIPAIAVLPHMVPNIVPNTAVELASAAVVVEPPALTEESASAAPPLSTNRQGLWAARSAATSENWLLKSSLMS